MGELGGKAVSFLRLPTNTRRMIDALEHTRSDLAS